MKKDWIAGIIDQEGFRILQNVDNHLRVQQRCDRSCDKKKKVQNRPDVADQTTGIHHKWKQVSRAIETPIYIVKFTLYRQKALHTPSHSFVFSRMLIGNRHLCQGQGNVQTSSEAKTPLLLFLFASTPRECRLSRNNLTSNSREVCCPTHKKHLRSRTANTTHWLRKWPIWRYDDTMIRRSGSISQTVIVRAS
jgi:hypothetical protein